MSLCLHSLRPIIVVLTDIIIMIYQQAALKASGTSAFVPMSVDNESIAAETFANPNKEFSWITLDLPKQKAFYSL